MKKKKFGPNQAAELLNTTPMTIRCGLREGLFPWGYAIKMSSIYTYIINVKKFEEIEGVKVGDEYET